MVRPLTLSLLLLGTCAAGPARADAELPRKLKGVGYDQKLNEQVPLDVTFRDEDGRTVRLGEYFHGKPVILVVVYYGCPKLCGEVLNGLTRCLLELSFDAGKEFEVVAVSFDAREKPALAKDKKETYLHRYGRPGAEAGWHFLTGDEPSIRRLTQAVGFRYTYDPRTDQFAHPSGIVFLTPKGKIYRYYFDVRYHPRDVKFTLMEAAENRIGTVYDKILFYCFHYDPAEGKYGAAIMNILRVCGAVTVLAIGGFIYVLRRRERRGPSPKAETEA